MSFFLKGCEVFALRTRLGAGVNSAKFQEVLILDGVFMGQVVDDSSFLQEFETLCDWAFDFHLAKLYLGERTEGKGKAHWLLRFSVACFCIQL